MKWLAGVLLAVVAQPAAPADDPWAPGATAEPWPLVAALQRYAEPGDPAPDWDRAVRHEEPIVRAAAAAAIGRAPDPRREGDLALLLSDRVALVRQTAQWAALQQPGQPTVELAARILAEPWQQHALIEGHLPRDKRDANIAREWLRGLPPGPLPALPPTPGEATPYRASISTPRSEYDADEVVDLAARVVTEPGPGPSTLGVPSSVEPHDPWRDPARITARRSPRVAAETSSVEVTVRVVGGDGTSAIALEPSKERAIGLALDLDGLPPDVYRLTFGNPLFLRVRRSAAQDAEGQAVAPKAAASDDALVTVSRLRMRAAAPALERYFSESLDAYGYGFNTWRATLALARVGDGASADLVLPPLLRTKGFLDPYGSQPPDLVSLLTTGFAGAARPRLDAFVSAWNDAIDRGFGDSLCRLLADQSYGPDTAVDAPRLDVLAQLGSVDHDPRRSAFGVCDPLDAALTGAARDHPDAVASVLARGSSRPGFASRLRSLLAALPPEAAERLVRAVAAALPATASDALAGVAAEAERLGVRIPGAAQVSASATETERQLREALGPGTTPDVLARAIGRGRESLAREASPMVALLVADAELWRGCWQEAERVAPDPAAVPVAPYGYGRPHAHAVRGRVAAARGRLAEAAVELAAAGALSNWAHQDLTKSLAERIAAAGPDAEGRVRFLPLASVPGGARTVETETGEAVLRRAESGCGAPARDEPRPAPPGPLWTNGKVDVHQNGASGLNAWTTGFPPRRVWSTNSLYKYVVLQDQVLALTEGELRRLDLASGRAIWATPSSMRIERMVLGGDLAVLWAEDKVMSAYDLRDGRRLWTRDFEGVVPQLKDNVADYVVARDSARVYLRNRGELIGLSAEDGRTLWTIPFVQDPREAIEHARDEVLVAVDGGSVWWLGELSSPGRYAAQRLVDRDGVVRLNPPTTGERRAAQALRDGTLLVRPPYGSFLEVWDPR